MEQTNTIEETPVREGIKIVGVRSRDRGIIIHFNPEDEIARVGDYVITDGDYGEEIGRVVSPPRYILKVLNNKPLKKVLLVADSDDLQKLETHTKMEQEAFSYCNARIEDRGLPMKLIDVEYSFNETSISFYFSADTRIDFRELVKDLAYKFNARMISGFGPCGRSLCCATFLKEFATVSIRMAREQGIVINPARISGMCGRLMCCIAYEHGLKHDKG